MNSHPESKVKGAQVVALIGSWSLEREKSASFGGGGEPVFLHKPLDLPSNLISGAETAFGLAMGVKRAILLALGC